MIILKRGKGKGDSYKFGIGMAQAILTKEMLNCTVKQIANKLMDQGKIKNGEIQLESINFMTYNGREEK